MPCTKPNLTEAEALTKLELHTPTDFLHYYPKSHAIYQRTKLIDVRPGDTVTIVGQIVRHRIFEAKSGDLVIQSWTIANKAGQYSLTCTHFHHPKTHPHQCTESWRTEQHRFYCKGSLVQLSGTIKRDDYTDGLAIDASEVVKIRPQSLPQIPKQTIQPRYKLSKGLELERLQTKIKAAIAQTQLTDPLPAKLWERYALVALDQAIAHIHFPPNTDALNAARQRLVFDEFFYLQLALLYRRYRLERHQSQSFNSKSDLLNQLYTKGIEIAKVKDPDARQQLLGSWIK